MLLLFMCFVLLNFCTCQLPVVYEPTWDDLDDRPLPQWYDEAKIGIFVHWGLYSVPAFHSEWFWFEWDRGNKDVLNFVRSNNISSYENFAKEFTGEYFDPDDWAELFFKAGAKYVVLTTKHHDGFALFPSSGDPGWNSVEIGPHKDIVDLVAKSVRKYPMKFGVYYSLLEWHNKIYSKIKNKTDDTIIVKYVEHVMFPDIKKLIQNYKPSVLWSDGDWTEHPDTWRAEEILAWIYNEKSVADEIVVNDRWGIISRFNHGDFYSGHDRFIPTKLIFHKFENAFTLDKKSWGYVQHMEVMSLDEMLWTVVKTVSFGGNALINVGPMKEGVIPLIIRERLLQLGEWLKINGEAIYGTSPWYYQQDIVNPDVWYTCKKKYYDPFRISYSPSVYDQVLAVYAIFFKWPLNGILKLRTIEYSINITMYKIYLLASINHNIARIKLEHTIFNSSMSEIYLPSFIDSTKFYAWVLKIIPEPID